MTFDLNEFFAGITLRSLQSSHARLSDRSKNPMPRETFTRDYTTTVALFGSLRTVGNATSGWANCRKVNLKGDAEEWL